MSPSLVQRISSWTRRSLRCTSKCPAVLLVILCAMAPLADSKEPEVPLVRVKQGLLRGTSMTTAKDRPVAAFLGIPYAEAPVGHLRFKDPTPLKGWDGIWNAMMDPPACIQKDILFDQTATVSGKEDCLTLSVYVNLDHLKRSGRSGYECGKYAVMVYFHGGGWIVGSGASRNYGPLHLLDRDVILVTVNHRMSVFGFLCTGDEASPGNYALKDQSLALRWVRDNIGYFGGDEESVTIFGQSAGAASVQYHVLSPLSKGLFGRAISHSGSSIDSWAMARKPLETAKEVARLVNCPDDKGNEEMVECLRRKPADEIAQELGRFVRWDRDPMFTFAPCVENATAVEKPFIAKHPCEIMASGEFNKVVWMCGVTRDDGSFRTATVLSDDKKANELNEDFEKLGPLTLRFEGTADKPNATARAIRRFYFGEKAIGVDTYKILTELYSHRYFYNGLVLSVKVMARHPNKLPRVYFYKFSHRFPYSNTDSFPVRNETTHDILDLGVTHGDELLCLFPMSDVRKGPLRSQDDRVCGIVVEMWTNFAKEGNPNRRWGSGPSLERWVPVTEDIRHFPIMEIGAYDSEPLRMTHFPDEYWNHYLFWKSLKLKENEVCVKQEDA